MTMILSFGKERPEVGVVFLFGGGGCLIALAGWRGLVGEELGVFFVWIVTCNV